MCNLACQLKLWSVNEWIAIENDVATRTSLTWQNQERWKIYRKDKDFLIFIIQPLSWILCEF